MKDRIPGSPGRYSAILPAGELEKLKNGEPFAIILIRDDEPIVVGTPYSKAAVLPDALAQQLCPKIADPSPADAFTSLNNNKAPSINRGNFKGDLDIIGEGGVQLNSVVWVSKDAKSPFPDSWGWAETWGAFNNSVVQRATEITGKMWVRTYYYKNSTVGAIWTDWKRVDSLDSAPAGFGLGTGAVYGTSPNSIFNGGFYRWDVANEQTPFANGVMIVVPREKDDRATQLAFCNAGTEKGVMAVRATKAGDVGEWEYINPPMTPGVEYRTTERFNGSRVYAKMLDFGSGPSEYYKLVDVADYIGDVVRIEGYWYDKEFKRVKKPFVTADFCKNVSVTHCTDPSTGKVTWQLSVIVDANADTDAASYYGLPVVYYTKREL